MPFLEGFLFIWLERIQAEMKLITDATYFPVKSRNCVCVCVRVGLILYNSDANSQQTFVCMHVSFVYA